MGNNSSNSVNTPSTNSNDENERIDEVLTNNNLTKINLNLYTVIKSVCKIITNDEKIGTGFFIKLYRNNKEFFCLMTNEHVITRELINLNEKIIIYYDAENERNDIILNKKERFIKDYKDINIDVTIIEILKKDNIDKKYFLLPYIGEYATLTNENIYIVQFPCGDLSYSNGKILKIDKYEITHDVDTLNGSSGSPILLENTTRVLGIHKQGHRFKKINYGNFIYPIIKGFESSNNDLDKIIEISDKQENQVKNIITKEKNKNKEEPKIIMKENDNNKMNNLKKINKNIKDEENYGSKIGYGKNKGNKKEKLDLIYDMSPERELSIITNFLENSKIYIYKNENSDEFIVNETHKEEYIEIRILEILRYKIIFNENKGKIGIEFLNIVDFLIKLTNILNKLYKLGNPNIISVTIKIIDSKVYEINEKDNEKIIRKDLENILDYYKEEYKKFKKSIIKGYENFQYLRLFFGKQFINLYKSIINNEKNLSYLLRCITLNKIKNFNIDYNYAHELDIFQNINEYLEKLFSINKINLKEIYYNNIVKPNIDLVPGLYRKIGFNINDDLFDILNIYLNITGDFPTFNTLLICNEETNIEKIQSFFYRSIYCDMPILFLIVNMERLESNIVTKSIRILKKLYISTNHKINSYIIFMYKK